MNISKYLLCTLVETSLKSQFLPLNYRPDTEAGSLTKLFRRISSTITTKLGGGESVKSVQSMGFGKVIQYNYMYIYINTKDVIICSFLSPCTIYNNNIEEFHIFIPSISNVHSFFCIIKLL